MAHGLRHMAGERTAKPWHLKLHTIPCSPGTVHPGTWRQGSRRKRNVDVATPHRPLNDFIAATHCWPMFRHALVPTHPASAMLPSQAFVLSRQATCSIRPIGPHCMPAPWFDLVFYSGPSATVVPQRASCAVQESKHKPADERTARSTAYCVPRHAVMRYKECLQTHTTACHCCIPLGKPRTPATPNLTMAPCASREPLHRPNRTHACMLTNTPQSARHTDHLVPAPAHTTTGMRVAHGNGTRWVNDQLPCTVTHPPPCRTGRRLRGSPAPQGHPPSDAAAAKPRSPQPPLHIGLRAARMPSPRPLPPPFPPVPPAPPATAARAHSSPQQGPPHPVLPIQQRRTGMPQIVIGVATRPHHGRQIAQLRLQSPTPRSPAWQHV